MGGDVAIAVSNNGKDTSALVNESNNGGEIVKSASAGKNVPAFLLKLFNMVNDHSTDDLIKWNSPGDSFLVMRHEDFAKTLLPRYYKHNNFSSFVRQLNMYGFHKIPHIEDNAFQKAESQIWEFSNPNFHRDQPDLLCLVTRKKSGETGDKDNLDFQTIIGEIQAIKRHQMTISQDLKRIQADNQALWQEQIDTRARHSRHQETIDKILNFLGSVYGNQRQDEKSIRPKKRKLLLQHDSNEQIQSLDNIFDDDKTKETFDNMFKSASTSPNLRPLRQPANHTTAASSTPQTAESRFTLPNFENRQQAASAPTASHQIRNMNKINNPVNGGTSSTGRMDSSPQERKPSISSLSTPPRQITLPENQLSYAFASNDPSNPLNMQLTPSLQNRITNNNTRASEIEQDLALQDQNIEALASLLGLDPSDLDTSTLDPNLLYETGLNNFDDFLNTNASVAATPTSTTNGFDAMGQGNEGHSIDSFLTDPKPAYASMPPPTTTTTTTTVTPDAMQLGSGSGGVGGGAKITSADTTPTPSSNAGSVHEEEVEEIDMERARGKRRSHH